MSSTFSNKVLIMFCYYFYSDKKTPETSKMASRRCFDIDENESIKIDLKVDIDMSCVTTDENQSTTNSCQKSKSSSDVFIVPKDYGNGISLVKEEKKPSQFSHPFVVAHPTIQHSLGNAKNKTSNSRTPPRGVNSSLQPVKSLKTINNVGTRFGQQSSFTKQAAIICKDMGIKKLPDTAVKSSSENRPNLQKQMPLDKQKGSTAVPKKPVNPIDDLFGDDGDDDLLFAAAELVESQYGM